MKVRQKHPKSQRNHCCIFDKVNQAQEGRKSWTFSIKSIHIDTYSVTRKHNKETRCKEKKIWKDMSETFSKRILTARWLKRVTQVISQWEIVPPQKIPPGYIWSLLLAMKTWNKNINYFLSTLSLFFRHAVLSSGAKPRFLWRKIPIHVFPLFFPTSFFRVSFPFLISTSFFHIFFRRFSRILFSKLHLSACPLSIFQW